jgi:hypothetical protein
LKLLEEEMPLPLTEFWMTNFVIAGWRPEGFVGDKKLYIEELHDASRPGATDLQLRTVGGCVRDKLVVATCIFNCHAVVGGKAWGGAFVMTYIWVNKDGSWEAIACHSNPISPPATG